jgi:exo-1,4-beta-D-glucosaminidase
MIPFQTFSQVGNSVRKIELKDQWRVQQTAKFKLPGKVISVAGFQTEHWLTGSVPSTVMGILTSNAYYKDVLVGKNFTDVDTRQFTDSWWFRKEFDLPEINEKQHITLHFDGINYYANIWLNGKLIASRDSVFGTFRQFSFDVTTSVTTTGNVLAVEIFKAHDGDLNLGFVDWNPRPQDENMGIWRPVYLEITDEVDIRNTVVQSKVNTSTLDEAWLNLKTELTNHSQNTITGKLVGNIENQTFSYPVTLSAGETKAISLSSDEITMFHFKNPRLWWANNLGSPDLYELSLRFETEGYISDAETITFGIRQIDMYTNNRGHKGFKLNGREILIKGAGWTDEIYLRDTKESLETQIQYVKHMNLNTIRLESFWGTSQDLYDLCDKYGILIMAGWSCQWEWEEYIGKVCDEFGGVKTAFEMQLAVESLRDQLMWLRNHPSIFVWLFGSDKLPRPELEKQYIELIRQNDDRPYLLSAGTRVSELSGPTGVKMNGPYEYVAPSYWYMDTINGGAFGFNTETGPGAQLPVYESIKKMIPENQLWPIGEVWDYHCTHSLQGFNTMEVTSQMLENRYGKTTGLDDYLKKSDAQSYEALRAMFEAFRVRLPKTTGIIHWMLNSAWPSVYWQLYDYYLLPTSAYYAARKANEPLQLIYDYYNKSVFAVNETRKDADNQYAIITLLDFDSKVLLRKKINFKVRSNKSEQILKLDSLNTGTFLDLKMFDRKGHLINQNFYWLSATPDVFDWAKTTWAYTPLKEFADFSELGSLPTAEIKSSVTLLQLADQIELKLDLKNQSDKTAFFINLTLLDKSDNQMFPVFWDDNYISILPGESRQIRCLVPRSSLKSEKMSLSVYGWNFEKQLLEIKY